MDYERARGLAPGDQVKTAYGDAGEVLDAHDTGSSVLLRVIRADGRVLDVHAAHAWPLAAADTPAPPAAEPG